MFEPSAEVLAGACAGLGSCRGVVHAQGSVYVLSVLLDAAGPSVAASAVSFGEVGDTAGWGGCHVRSSVTVLMGRHLGGPGKPQLGQGCSPASRD